MQKVHDELRRSRETIARLEQELEALKATHKDLVKSEISKRMIFSDLPLCEFYLDENNIIEDVNSGIETCLGYSREELLGQSFADILVDGMAQYKRIFPEFKKKGYAKDEIVEIYKKDGSIISMLINARAVYDDNGKYQHGVGLGLDITEKLKMMESLRKTEREKAIILDVMNECIVYFSVDMNIIWTSNNISKIEGMCDFSSGSSVCHEKTDEGRCRLCPVFATLKTNKKESAEIKIRDKFFLFISHPVFGNLGELNGAVLVIIDITERKNLEIKLMDMGSEERKKIGNDMHDSLGQVLTGVAFLAAASAQEIKDRFQYESVYAARVLEYSKKAQEIMRRLIKGLCPVSDEPTALMAALAFHTDNLADLYQIKSVFRCPSPVCINDYNAAIHLFYIAQEAMCNAVKHSKCSELEVELKIVNSNIILSVADNGKGIDCITKGCSGMGLKIMRHRALMINAEFNVVSDKTKGTAVKVTLPLKH
ncbi:hypothetical protein ADMFC3_00630 [Geovibrio sp. ADMFC3]